MTVAVIDKSDLKKNPGMPFYQCLAEHIIGRIRSGELTPGYRLPTEHNLAKQLGVNRLTVRKSYQLLKGRNLVECCRGMGTFVSKTSCYSTSSRRSEKTIYFLIPHPVHITLQEASSVSERQIHYGMSMVNDGNLIQLVPVSKQLENPLAHIDWEIVLQIPEGARVLVTGMWYKDLLPFLLERKVHGVFLETQYEKVKYKEEYDRLVEAKWNFITLDRLSAMEQAVEYLYNLKRRRIAVIKRYKNEPLHPYRLGMRSGYERCGMVYDDNLYHEIGWNISPWELENEIVELWKRTQFDAFIVGGEWLLKPIYKALTAKLQLQLPDDVALMAFSDISSYLDFPVPVTAITFPNVNVGRETVRILNRRKPIPEKLIFQATVIERESTRKGAGAYVNHAFLPEIPLNPNSIIN